MRYLGQSYVCRQCLRSLRSTRRPYATTTTRTALDDAASPEIYDVVCVGGGPAGLSLLTALRMPLSIIISSISWWSRLNEGHMILGATEATSHLKLALVESQDLGRLREWNLPTDQYSNRVSSLTPASVAFLDCMCIEPVALNLFVFELAAHSWRYTQ